MEIYATVTNWDSKAPALQNQTGLYHIDYDKKLITRFVTFQTPASSTGFTGLTYDSGYVYLAGQGSTSQAIITKVHRKEFTIAGVFTPPSIRKISQIDILDDILWVASSDSSEIIALKSNDAQEIGRFQADSTFGTPQSLRILPSIVVATYNRSLVHIPWSRSSDGTIQFGSPQLIGTQSVGEISNGQPLAGGGSLLLDRSSSSLIVDGTVVSLKGSPRGIAYDASDIYVGLSNRSPSRAAIVRISRSTLEIKDQMMLPESGDIFDVRLTYVTDYGMSQAQLSLRSGIVKERTVDEPTLANPIPMLDKKKIGVRI